MRSNERKLQQKLPNKQVKKLSNEQGQAPLLTLQSQQLLPNDDGFKQAEYILLQNIIPLC